STPLFRLTSSSHIFILSDTPPSPLSTLSLHDALPIYPAHPRSPRRLRALTRAVAQDQTLTVGRARAVGGHPPGGRARARADGHRSEEHTSELQSRFDLVCRLLLEKKKNKRLIDSMITN